MRRLAREKLEEAGPNGLPTEGLADALRKKGYYIPSIRHLIDMLPALEFSLDSDGVVRLK